MTPSHNNAYWLIASTAVRPFPRTSAFTHMHTHLHIPLHQHSSLPTSCFEVSKVHCAHLCVWWQIQCRSCYKYRESLYTKRQQQSQTIVLLEDTHLGVCFCVNFKCSNLTAEQVHFIDRPAHTHFHALDCFSWFRLSPMKETLNTRLSSVMCFWMCRQFREDISSF